MSLKPKIRKEKSLSLLGRALLSPSRFIKERSPPKNPSSERIKSRRRRSPNFDLFRGRIKRKASDLVLNFCSDSTAKKRLDFLNVGSLWPRKDLKDLFDQFTTRRMPDSFGVPKIILSSADSSENENAPGMPKISSPAKVIKLSSFKNFLEKKQLEQHTEKEVEDLIQRYEPNPMLRLQNSLSFEGFTRYLMDEKNFAFAKLRHDEREMDYPLSNYYIASSHNTYLTGHQLKGKSSIDLYCQVLLSGCRCVELDCYDGDDGSPVIYHGHTLTTKIPFQSVVEAINLSAFVASPYPVILSIENHCSVPQQEKMAQIFQDVFKEKLFSNSIDSLPSLNQLKYKILIKNKKIAVQNGQQQLSTSKESFNDIDDEQCDNLAAKKQKSQISQELSNLVYVEAIKFTGDPMWRKRALFSDSQEEHLCYKCTSLNENLAKKLSRKQPKILMSHTETHLVRTYPARKRINSSNFNPLIFWASGIQMVALNYQTEDAPLHINSAMFEQNGRCGYVPKPSIIRDPGRFNPWKKELGLHSLLILKVISGQNVDPTNLSTDVYVDVKVFGIPVDCGKQKTKVVQRNLNQIWNEQFFFRIAFPDLAFLRIAVIDANTNKNLCQRVLPLKCLQAGYRHVRMRDLQNMPLQSTLFLYSKTEGEIIEEKIEYQENKMTPLGKLRARVSPRFRSAKRRKFNFPEENIEY